MSLIDNITKTYSAQAKCTNCFNIQDVRIPKGVTVENYFKESGKCNSCGCRTLIKFEAQKINPEKNKVGKIEYFK